MTSIKERLMAAHGANNDYIRLQYDLRLSVKLDSEDNQPGFNYYVKDESGGGKNVWIKSPLSGILVGRCMYATWYDGSWGKNGALWSTAPYIVNTNITLFSPDGKVATRGTKEEVDMYLYQQGVRSTPRKFQFILLRVKSKNGWSTLAIATNITIAITEMNKVGRDKVLYNFITLTPKAYVPGLVDFEKSTPKATIALMATNPPKFASISLGAEVSDAVLEESGVESAIKEFKSWAESVGAKKPEPTQPQNVASPQPPPSVIDEGYSGPSASDFDSFSAPSPGAVDLSDYGANDDLPF